MRLFDMFLKLTLLFKPGVTELASITVLIMNDLDMASQVMLV